MCTISVIYSQVEDREEVIRVLSGELGLPEDQVRPKVEKRSAREIIKTNVDKETGDKIRSMGLAGVKVDEDYKRYYPYDSLASKVLGRGWSSRKARRTGLSRLRAGICM